MNILDQMRQAAFSGSLKQNNPPQATFDGLNYSAEDDMAAAELSTLKLDVAGGISSWLETDDSDLDAGETLVDRFDAIMIGTVDADKNGDLDDDELDVLELAYGIASDYLISQGVNNEDVAAMLNDGDEAAAENIHEFLINMGVDGEDAEMAAINAAAFEFDEDSDSAVMDATYKRTVAICNGVKTIVRKRISGTVKLSAKQKAAIKKMQLKAHSGKARAKRLKSLKRRKAMGL